MRAAYLIGAGAFALCVPACGSSPPPADTSAKAASSGIGAGAPSASGAASTASKPHHEALLAPWTGPHGGVPPFADVRIADFVPALTAAMDEKRREIARIADGAEPPTFDNTIAALERSGKVLDRVESVYDVWSSTMSVAEFQAVERDMAPKLAALDDEIAQNEKLFARVAAVYEAREKSNLTPEQKRLAWKRYTALVRAGAKLDAAAKKRVAEINQRLASLFTSFNQNVLADEDTFITLDSEADLAGLPESVRAGAAAAAEARGEKGRWAIKNTRSAVEPFLTYATRADLREKVWKAFVSRGDLGDAHDNKKIISEILALRAERAKLLGYESHAHWRVENTMAKTPERAMALMEEVWPAAVARVREEVKDMQALANKSEDRRKIAPSDYRFYAEKVRKAKYDLDENEVKSYLELEKLREAMFWVAGELFGFSFAPAKDIPVYHPDVRVWEVKAATSGKHVGLWYFDPYARAGKRSGAWMNAYRVQERVSGEISPIVSNNSNFVKSKPGEPVLISWEDARTLFHEFGHALHGLSSNVTYPTLAGTRVARDYVEFPSQLLERWLSTPEVLEKFATHHLPGAPMPRPLVEKIERAATFNQGFGTVEYLSAALVDMKLHLAGGKPIDPDAFERDTLRSLGMPSEIVMRHRTPQFSHLFSSDSYSAGYYSYLWSDTLSADAFEAFTEGKGAYDKAVAARLREQVFAVGDTIDPAEGYRGFRGRDAGTAALMRKRGFAKRGTAKR